MPPAALGWWAGRQWDSDSSQSSSASSRSAVPRATSGTGTLDRGGRNLGSRLGRAIDGLFPGPWATTSLTPPELSYCTPRAWDWGAWCQHWALTLWYNKVTAREMYHMVTQQAPPPPPGFGVSTVQMSFKPTLGLWVECQRFPVIFLYTINEM